MNSFAIAQELVNVIRNSQFDDGVKLWKLEKFQGATGAIAANGDGLLSGVNSCAITPVNAGTESSHLQLTQTFTLAIGRIYTFSFMARSTTPHTIQAVFQKGTSEYTNYWEGVTVDIDDTPRTFGPYQFISRVDGVSNRLKFLVGGKNDVVVYIDSVVVTSEDDPTYFTTFEKFLYRDHTFDGTTLPYRLCIPDFYDPSKEYPLVLALHGAGERGSDNELPISVHRMATMWADSSNQLNYPCFVVAPQCPTDNRWVDSDWSTGEFSIAEMPISNELLTVNDLVNSLIQEFSVDTNRLYITGLSMGGYGTWYMISVYPDKYAAAIPMSGGGDSTFAQVIKDIPIWDFHGEKDGTVPVSGSRDMINALERVGRNPIYTNCNNGDCTGMTSEEIDQAIHAGASLLYTEWKGKDHVMWAESYDLPQLLPWVFSQNKAYPLGINKDSGRVEQFQLAQNYPNPFNPTTNIEYTLNTSGYVSVEIFNVLGQKVITLVNSKQAAGNHSVQFNGSGLESGMYYYQIKMDGHSSSKKMMMIK